MEKLRTDYLDLMLLHQPFGDTYGAWRALEELYEAGKLRTIGISNHYVDRMVEFSNFTRIKPMVNQMEVHPLFDFIVSQSRAVIRNVGSFRKKIIDRKYENFIDTLACI